MKGWRRAPYPSPWPVHFREIMGRWPQSSTLVDTPSWGDDDSHQTLHCRCNTVPLIHQRNGRFSFRQRGLAAKPMEKHRWKRWQASKMIYDLSGEVKRKLNLCDLVEPPIIGFLTTWLGECWNWGLAKWMIWWYNISWSIISNGSVLIRHHLIYELSLNNYNICRVLSNLTILWHRNCL